MSSILCRDLIFYATILLGVFCSSFHVNKVNQTVDDVSLFDDNTYSEGSELYRDKGGLVEDSPNLSDVTVLDSNATTTIVTVLDSNATTTIVTVLDSNETTTIDNHNQTLQSTSEKPEEHGNSKATTETESSIKTSTGIVSRNITTENPQEHRNQTTTKNNLTSNIVSGSQTTQNPTEHGLGSTADVSETKTSVTERNTTENPAERGNSSATIQGLSTEGPTDSPVSSQAPDAGTKSLSQEIKERLERGDVLTVVILVLIILVALAIIVGIGICYKTRKLKRRGTVIDDSYSFSDITSELQSESRDNPTYAQLDGAPAVQLTDLNTDYTDVKAAAYASK